MKYRFQVLVGLVLDEDYGLLHEDLNEWLRDYVKRRLTFHPAVIAPKVKVFYEGRDE